MNNKLLTENDYQSKNLVPNNKSKKIFFIKKLFDIIKNKNINFQNLFLDSSNNNFKKQFEIENDFKQNLKSDYLKSELKTLKYKNSYNSNSITNPFDKNNNSFLRSKKI